MDCWLRSSLPPRRCGSSGLHREPGEAGWAVEGRAEKKAVISAATPTRDNLAIPDDDDTLGRWLLVRGFSMAAVLCYPGGASDDDVAVADLGLVHGVSLFGRGPSGFK